MDTLNFLCHEDLAEYMGACVRDGKVVYVVTNYENAKALLKELACFEEIDLFDIELLNPNYDNYKKEYYVVLDSDYRVSIEKAYHEDTEYGDAGYFRFGDEDVIAFIDVNANSRVIKAAEGSSYIAEYEIQLDVSSFEERIEECEDFNDIFEFIYKCLLEE